MASADWESILRAMDSVYRRRLLVALLEHNPQDDTVNVPEDLHVGEKELEGLQTEMYHQHLPILQASGYVVWDEEAHEVVKGPKFEEIRPLLELIHAHRDELPDGWI